MSILKNWSRFLLVVLTLALLISDATAMESTANETTATDPPAGNPEFGLLIIAGLIGFLILVTWLFSRVSDTSHGTSDKSILN